MPFCAQCGAAQHAGQRFCPQCGAALSAPALPPAPAPPPARPDTGLAETLILLGGVASLLVPVLVGLVLLFLGGLFAMFPPFGTLPGVLFGLLAAVLLVVGVIALAISVYARNLLRDGQRERGATIAIIVGLVSVVLGNFIGGLLLLLGGMVAYTAK
jgi:hypothetical protein